MQDFSLVNSCVILLPLDIIPSSITRALEWLVGSGLVVQLRPFDVVEGTPPFVLLSEKKGNRVLVVAAVEN